MSKSTIRGVLTALFVVPLLGFLVLGHGTPTVRVAASQASDNQSADDHNGENCDNNHDSAEESHESDQAEMNENESKSEEANESDSDESAEESHEADDDCNAATTAPPTTAPPTTAPPTTEPPTTAPPTTGPNTTQPNGEDVCETDGLLGPETIADQLVDAGIPLNEPEADGPISSAIVSSLGALSPISSEAACVVSLLTL